MTKTRGIFTGEDSEGLVVSWIPEGKTSTWSDRPAVDVFLRNIQCHGYREEGAIGQTEGVDYTSNFYQSSSGREKMHRHTSCSRPRS